MSKIIYDIGIVGGGASGLMCSISAHKASEKKLNIAIFEKENRVGKKILATGNGKCNITNLSLENSYYNGSCANKVLSILETLNSNFLIKYFRDLGLYTKVDDSKRVYPITNMSSSVLDTLRIQNNFYNTSEFCGSEIISISKNKNGNFLIVDDKNCEFICKYLVITTGGKSGVNNYSGGGYDLLENLNVKINPLYPSLTPINVKSDIIKSLKGVRCMGAISLIYDEVGSKKSKRITEIGEIQFTDKAVSGVCTFQLSRYANEFFKLKTIKNKQVNKISLLIDVLQQESYSDLVKLLISRRNSGIYTIETLLSGLINNKLAIAIFKKCKINEFKRKAIFLNDKKIKDIANKIKNFDFEDLLPFDNFKNAQVTCGGIDVNEINFENLSCNKNNKLFFAGEVIDIDGLCGGYNLHWAFVSGVLVGESISDKIGSEKDDTNK